MRVCNFISWSTSPKTKSYKALFDADPKISSLVGIKGTPNAYPTLTSQGLSQRSFQVDSSCDSCPFPHF